MQITREKLKNRFNFGKCNFTVADGMDDVEILNYNNMFKVIGDKIKAKSVVETDGSYIIGKDMYEHPEFYSIEFWRKFGSRVYFNMGAMIYSEYENSLIQIYNNNNLYLISVYELFENSEIYDDNTCYVSTHFISTKYNESIPIGYY